MRRRVPDRRTRRPKAKLIGAAAVIVTLAVAAAFGVYKLLNRNPDLDTRNMRIRPLTDHGQAVGYASISPGWKVGGLCQAGR